MSHLIQYAGTERTTLQKNSPIGERIYVLDTNVLIHDPTAILRFDEHHVCLPMTVLMELDNNKSGYSEKAANARGALRIIMDIMRFFSGADPRQGMPIAFNDDMGALSSGKLYLGTEVDRSSDTPDTQIIKFAKKLQEHNPSIEVILVSKDINMLVRAPAMGVYAEDYASDRTLADADLLSTGYESVSSADLYSLGMQRDWIAETGKFTYRITSEEIASTYYPGLVVHDYENDQEPFSAIVRSVDTTHQTVTLSGLTNYMNPREQVWGIEAKNLEQSFAMNLLMDPEVHLVTLFGVAGTGKTLLTLAAGLAQGLERKLYKELIFTRMTVPLGEDIGFLPGTEEEKMSSWMGALTDNLEVLASPNEVGGDWGKVATNDLLSRFIKIRSANFMRGRTLQNRLLVIDEAQNLTRKQVRALVSRAGEGSKVIALGNIKQIDTPYLTPTTSGLTNLATAMQGFHRYGNLILPDGVRSELATEIEIRMP